MRRGRPHCATAGVTAYSIAAAIGYNPGENTLKSSPYSRAANAFSARIGSMNRVFTTAPIALGRDAATPQPLTRIGRIVSINRSDGGLPKHPVPEARITASGIEGDRQQDLRSHGGPERAVLLYSFELIRALQREGHSIRPGSAGENLTVSGLDWSLMAPGATIKIGEAQLQITRYASPCTKIAASFVADDISRLSGKLHSGWSRACARVLTGGMVRTGDLLEILE